MNNKRKIVRIEPAAGGLTGLLRMKLVSAQKNRVKGRMPWSESIVQGNGIIHGGALAALADTTGGVGAIRLAGPGTVVVTAEIKVNYFSNIKSGWVDSDARLLHRGRMSSVWEIRLYSSGKNHKLLALAVASYVSREAIS